MRKDRPRKCTLYLFANGNRGQILLAYGASAGRPSIAEVPGGASLMSTRSVAGNSTLKKNYLERKEKNCLKKTVKNRLLHFKIRCNKSLLNCCKNPSVSKDDPKKSFGKSLLVNATLGIRHGRSRCRERDADEAREKKFTRF